MKKLLLTFLFILGLTSVAQAEFKVFPKDLHDLGDVILDYYEPGVSGDTAISGSVSISTDLTVDNGVLYVDSGTPGS